MNWNEWPSPHRRFGGKTYTILGKRFRRKDFAEAEARAWRMMGYAARVVEYHGKYYIYYRTTKRWAAKVTKR